jgi:cytochrome c
MKYYYLNRIAMAVLVALLLFFGTRTVINIASEEHAPDKPGYDVAGHEKPHGMKEEPDADSGGGGSEVLAMLPDADAAQGEADAGLCKICHTFDQGGASLIGPNLYNVVNKDIASSEFAFTGGLKGKDGDWTYENLDVWLTNPQAFAPGTSMAFPGIPDVKKRANIIAFLRSKADTPAPLPEVSAEEPAATSDEPEEEMDEHDEMDEDEAEDMDGHDDMDASEAMEGTDEMEEPVAVEVIEETIEEILVVPATLSEDAPTEPHMGEDPSASQPQPVYPAEAMEVIEETMDVIIVVPAMLSEDAPTEPHMGEEPSASQPQPVYPDGGMDDGEAMAPAGGDAPSSQPQPVYPDGMPDGL